MVQISECDGSHSREKENTSTAIAFHAIILNLYTGWLAKPGLK
jgi:hypothetical protein